MFDDRCRVYADARDEVLRRCYLIPDCEEPLRSEDISREFGLSEGEFERHVLEELLCDYMVRQMRPHCVEEDGRGPGLQLDFNGIVAVEQRRLVDPRIVAQHVGARDHVLRILGVRHRTHPSLTWQDLEDFITPAYEPWIIKRACDYLLLSGAIQGDELFGKRMRISHGGLAQLRDIERLEELAVRLGEVEGLTAQPRGKALERLLAQALRLQGCVCHEAGGGDGEQIDLIIEIDARFYVCEVKWLKDRVQPKVVNELSGRLDSRHSAVLGVIFSMSGFTEAARRRAAGSPKERAILLMGGAETRAILLKERRFEDLAREQLRSLVMLGRL